MTFMYLDTCAHVALSVCVEVREQLSGSSSLLLCGRQLGQEVLEFVILLSQSPKKLDDSPGSAGSADSLFRYYFKSK